MRNWKIAILSITAIFMLVPSGFTQSRERNGKVLRNVKLTFSHVFDPSAVQTEVAFVNVQAPKPIQKNLSAKEKKDRAKFAGESPILRREGIITNGEPELNPDLGLGFVGAVGTGTPNDNHLAISDDGWIISTLNQVVVVLNEDGDLLKNWPLFYMSTNPENTKPEGDLPTLLRTYDPKVIYDDLNDKFILVFLNGVTHNDSRIVIGFSQTNDPTGKWNMYSVTGDPLNSGATWTDYPIIGTTQKDFFITVNILNDGMGWQDGFTQSVIWQIGKAEGFNGDTLNSNYFYDLKYNNKPVWSICPVQGSYEQHYKDMYFLSVRPSASLNDTVFLHYIDNTLESGEANWSIRQLKSDQKYGVPPTAYQKKAGFRLQTNDARVLSAFKHKHIIQYVQTTSNAVNQNSSIYHGKIVAVGEQDEVVSGRILTSDSMEYAYPSICYAGDGLYQHTAMLTFSHSSKYSNPGTSIVYCDDYNQYSSIVMTKKGESHINSFIADTAERWGDYTNIQRRYNNDGEIWAVGSYGNSSSKAGTWVAQVFVNNQLVGDEEFKIIQKNKVFPIPAISGQLNVALYAKENVTYVFEIYGVDGKLLKSIQQGNLSAGKNKITLSNLLLKPGTYVLDVKANGQVIFKEKVIIE